MPKKQKTRIQKISANIRKQEGNFYSLSNVSLNNTFVKKADKEIATYAYVKKDLIKTFLLSSILLLIQITFFITIKNHILKIPGITY